MDQRQGHMFLSTALAAGIALAVVAAFGIGLSVGSGLSRDQVGVLSGQGSIDVAQPTSTLSHEERMVESFETVTNCDRGSSGPMVCLEEATVNESGLFLRLRYVGFEPSIGAGMHAHVFAGSLDAEQAGTHGDHSVGGGPWQVVDSTSTLIPVDAGIGSDALADGSICVATATERHTLAHTEISCIEISG